MILENKNISKSSARFAPSPTGFMHLGNLAAALASYLDAKEHNLKWLVRIEDIDSQRCKPEYTKAIFEDLEWLGLVPDEEPIFQSERSEIYEEALKKLSEAGLTYECFSSRKEILEIGAPQGRGEAGTSTGSVTSGGAGIAVTAGGAVTAGLAVSAGVAGAKSPSIRLRAPDEIDEFSDLRFGFQSSKISDAAGDVVLKRSDGLWGYQLASSVDDALQGIALVTRGEDLIPSAHVQRFIIKQLGFEPPEYSHIPLVKVDGVRMAKRNGEKATLRYFRDELHYSKEQVLEIIRKFLSKNY